MADAMDRVRAAEARYQEVIERTTTLDRHVTGLDTHLANLRWTAEKTVEVLSNLRSELKREERAAKHRSETIEQANRVPLPGAQVVLSCRVHGPILWAPWQFCAGVGRVASGRYLRVILSRRRTDCGLHSRSGPAQWPEDWPSGFSIGWSRGSTP